MIKLIASGIIALSFTSSAFAQFSIKAPVVDGVQERFNIDIPTDGVEVEKVQGIINTIAGFIVQGHSEVAISDVFDPASVPAEYQMLVAKVLASRDPVAKVECLGRQCTILATGTALDFKVDGISLPLIGTPSVSLSKDITFSTQISEDGQRAEICRVSGVAIKAGFLKPTLDGALLEILDGAVKTFRVDAGTGGDYPSTGCDFVSQPQIPENEAVN